MQLISASRESGPHFRAVAKSRHKCASRETRLVPQMAASERQSLLRQFVWYGERRQCEDRSAVRALRFRRDGDPGLQPCLLIGIIRATTELAVLTVGFLSLVIPDFARGARRRSRRASSRRSRRPARGLRSSLRAESRSCHDRYATGARPNDAADARRAGGRDAGRSPACRAHLDIGRARRR